MRLYVLVEGYTEETFVKQTLGPHLQPHGIYVFPIIVTTSREERSGRKRHGGGHWKHWYDDLQRLIREQRASDVRFTTMFDLYGLPKDFPELDIHGADSDTVRRAGNLEKAMAQNVGDWRFIPYLQRHEFEALVLAGLGSLDQLLDTQEDLTGLAMLQRSVSAIPPEDVDDGATTAPSKRLESSIPSYEKPLHGPLAIQAVGLATIRTRCPRFDAWIVTLEGLRSGLGGD